VGVAVKVTEVPLQIEVLLAATVTEGLTELVVIVTALLFTAAGLAQGSLLVIDTVTILPLASVVVVNVAAVWPATFTPLISHW
jgi:hypothetical protein